MEGGWRNKLAYLGLADLQMPIIHTWNISLNMWNYHTNYRCAIIVLHVALSICAVFNLLSKAALAWAYAATPHIDQELHRTSRKRVCDFTESR